MRLRCPPRALPHLACEAAGCDPNGANETRGPNVAHALHEVGRVECGLTDLRIAMMMDGDDEAR